MTASYPRFHAVLVGWGLLLTPGASAIGNEPAVPEFHAALGELRESATLIGAGWKDSPGLVIEDVDALPKEPQTREDKLVASVAAALRPGGVVAVADYTYMTEKQDPTPDVITVRVLVFRSADAATQWWDKKYDAQGAGKNFYRAVDGLGDRAVDSTGIKKRIALAGNVIITCSQLKGGDDYSKVIARYAEKVAAVAQGKDGTPAPPP